MNREKHHDRAHGGEVNEASVVKIAEQRCQKTKLNRLPNRQRTPNAPLLARARMRAREKSLKNFRLVPLPRRYVQRHRALAVIMPIMPTSELVWLGRHGAA